MTVVTAPMQASAAEVAAALHEASGLPEVWDARSVAQLLCTPGIEGRFAICGDEPVGLVIWRIAADEAEILTIGVLPEWRRHAIGRALLETAIDMVRAQGVTRLFLEVAVDNEPAIGLYHALGFEQAGRRRSYYRTASGSTDAAVLVKRI